MNKILFPLIMAIILAPVVYWIMPSIQFTLNQFDFLPKGLKSEGTALILTCLLLTVGIAAALILTGATAALIQKMKGR